MCKRALWLLPLFLIIFFAINISAQTPRRGTSRRAPAPVAKPSLTPSPSPDVSQIVDGITEQYDAATNQTIVTSKEVVLYDNANEGAIHPIRVTMLLDARYPGRASTATANQASANPLVKIFLTSNPLVRILFKYKYFVAKFDVGEPRDFTLFTGGLNILASGDLKFLERQDVGGDVITTMQVGIKASEFDKILQSMKAAKSVGVMLGRDIFPFKSPELDLFTKFLAAVPHPAVDAAVANNPDAAGPMAPKCDLKIAQAPELRGFRLGMPVNDLLNRFPGVKPIDRSYGTRPIVDYNSGQIRFELYPVNYRGGYSTTPVENMTTRSNINTNFFQGLEGIFQINLDFTDGHLTTLRIAYDDKIKWSSLEEFRARTAEALGLSDKWKAGNLLSCDGFSIKADQTYPGMYIELKDVTTEQEFRKRQEEQKRSEEEKRKETFKP